MKKLSIILTLALVVALAAPAFADNVEITGEVTTKFETANYGDSPAATVVLWGEDDALDLDVFGDEDDYPAEKSFYQEIDFNIAGAVNDNTTFDLAVDTLTNVFAEEDTYGAYGDQSETDQLLMDSAQLTLDNAAYTIKLGDFGDYGVEDYFVDEEDLEGIEVNTAVAGHDVKAFVMGENDDFGDQDFYGVNVTKGVGALTLTGKYYTARSYQYDEDGDGTTDGVINATNMALAAKADVAKGVTANIEYVANDAEEASNSSNSVSDSLIKAGVTAEVNDALTVNADILNVGKDFVAVAWDLNGTDYSEYTVGADYAVDANTTVGGSYTMEDYAVNTNDTDTIELTLDKTMGALTTGVTFETEDVDGDKTNVLAVDGEYTLNDATTLTGKLANQSGDTADEYTYVKGGVEHKLAENVNWNTEAQLITGTTNGGTDGEGNSLSTELVVSF